MNINLGISDENFVVRNRTSRRGDYRTKVSEERSEVTEEAEDLIVNFENRRLIWIEKFCS